MNIDRFDLLLVWIGGGFAIFLAWAIILGQGLLGPNRLLFRPLVAALAAVGVVHPAAAFATADLLRWARRSEEPDLEFPVWTQPVWKVLGATSLSVSAILWLILEPGW